MSLLALLITLVLVITSGSLVGEMSARAADRARAQTAADAAALGAAAEATIYGSQAPYGAALQLASANGAELLSCLCEPGASAFQVEVSVGDDRATARAVIEADRLAPAVLDGLVPEMSVAIDRLLAAAGGRVWIVSGFRSAVTQERLWAAAVARYGDEEIADDWVARPGTSMHERGLAVDLGGDVEAAAAVAIRLGLPLTRPMSWEPWHFELDVASGGVARK